MKTFQSSFELNSHKCRVCRENSKFEVSANIIVSDIAFENEQLICRVQDKDKHWPTIRGLTNLKGKGETVAKIIAKVDMLEREDKTHFICRISDGTGSI